jgi:murein DD-endopeptidase MepM/ murein hydrolase activator NlpD
MIGTVLVGLLVSQLAPAPIRLSIESRAPRPGELVVLAIESVAHPQIRVFDREVTPYRVGDGEWRALIGIDLDVKPATYAISVWAGADAATCDLVVAPRTFRTRHLTVDEAFVTPPADAGARIAADAKLLAGVWASPSAERLWSEPFVRPVPGPANSAFGTRSVFNGKPRSAHGGADFLSAGGTPVHAPNAGRVAVARNLYFSGNTVVIDHGLGLFSMLAHLSTMEVHEGDRVAAGQIVGLVGATGRVTGPHLHWAVRADDARIDPLSLLALLGAPGEKP